MTINGKAYIVGAYEHPTRKAPDKSVAQLHAECAQGALADAGLRKDDIDGYFCSGDAPGMGPTSMVDYMNLRCKYVDSTDLGGASYLALVNHAARAIACALELDALSQSFRDSWRDKGVAVGTTRIGVHAGPALVGNFGGGRFFDYTAYGDTINIAARLESANKQLGTRICVSASAAARVDGFRGRPVGDLMLRGRAEALRALEPLSSKQYDDPSTASYLEAFGRLEAGDANALTAFAAQIGKCPDDQLASFHLKRLLNGAKGTRISLD